MKDRFDTITIDFESLFESAPNMYIAVSPDLKIIGASDAYLDATGSKRHKILGSDLFEICTYLNTCTPDETSEMELPDAFQYVLKRKESMTLDVQKLLLPAGRDKTTERYWNMHLIPVLFEKQQILCVILRVEDVTEMELVRIEAKVQTARNTELEAAEKIHLRNLKESEARFIKVFNLSPAPLFMTKVADGKLVLVNSAFEKFTGINSAATNGKTLMELGILDAPNIADLNKQLAGDHSNDIEFCVTTKSGSTRKMLATSEIVEVDNMLCHLVAMLDITVRKNHENDLMQSNHFLDTILEHLPGMVFVKDAETLNYIRINKAGELLTGISQKDIAGKNNADIYPAEHAEEITRGERELIERRLPSAAVEELIKTGGSDKWLHTRRIPVYEDGKPVYLVGISEDVTEQKKQQEAILQLNKELEAFSYSVSHDLRAPLRAVTGYAQMLDEDYAHVLDSEGKRLLHTISDNAEKMGALIDNLLTFSRLGRKELTKRETDMNGLVTRALAEISKSTEHVATIKVNELHQVMSDPDLMTQVLINLIENAIKYTSRKPNPEIEISSYVDGSEVVYCVSDNGAGFDMKYYDKLFGVFQRLHAVDEYAGTGVGLAIVQRIIARHGGRVWAKGKVNEGATFCFALPISNTK